MSLLARLFAEQISPYLEDPVSRKQSVVPERLRLLYYGVLRNFVSHTISLSPAPAPIKGPLDFDSPCNFISGLHVCRSLPRDPPQVFEYLKQFPNPKQAFGF